MKRRNFFIHIFAVLLLLTGCSSTKPDEVAASLTPLPDIDRVVDPDSTLLMDAIKSHFAEIKAPKYTQYEFTRIDLDQDGRREGIVMMKTPYKYWCNNSGCAMTIFKAHNDSFSLMSEISPIRGPLVVSEQQTNGWRDLIVHVYGKFYADDKNVALRFDGMKYPTVPAFEPALPKYAAKDIEGVEIFP